MSSEKHTGNTSDFEVDSQDLHLQSKVGALRRTDSARVGLTVLALLMGLTALGVSGNAIYVYNNTRVASSFLSLALWPDDFSLQPAVALVVGGVIILLTNIVSLLFSKVQVVRQYPPRPLE